MPKFKIVVTQVVTVEKDYPDYELEDGSDIEDLKSALENDFDENGIETFEEIAETTFAIALEE